MSDAIETIVLRVDPARPDAILVRQAAQQIRAGGLVAFPTETVYGLGANALDAQAVARIFAAKGRPSSDPLIVHISDITQLDLVALDPPNEARRLAQQFWPGPLTLVLLRRPLVPAIVSAGLPTVAVRVPAHPVAQALIAAAGVPIAAPSANLFARTSPTTAQHVLDDLRGRVDIVLDGGPTPIGLESTVVSLVDTPPLLLRPGGISAELLRAQLPTLQYSPRYLESDQAAAAPGMLTKHYSPRAELWLFIGPLESVLAHMAAKARQLVDQGRSVGILAPDEEHKHFAGLVAQVVLLGPHADLDTIGARLFAGMRELDAAGVDVILVRGFEQQGLGLAIGDRLLRASEGHVVVVPHYSHE